MKYTIPAIALCLTIFLTSCQAIGDIFKTGVGVGVVGVIALIVIILFLVMRAKK